MICNTFYGIIDVRGNQAGRLIGVERRSHRKLRSSTSNWQHARIGSGQKGDHTWLRLGAKTLKFDHDPVTLRLGTAIT